MTPSAVEVTGDAALEVRIDQAPQVVGWQLFDPVTGLFIQEGQWVQSGGSGVARVEVELPVDDGRYRVYVSGIDEPGGWHYLRGRPFLLIDAEIVRGRARVIGSRVTTLARMRLANLPEALRIAFVAPFASIWTHRALIRSMVRRDIQGRYRGSAGDVAWTFLHPLLLMAAYYFVFGLVLQARFAADPSRSGFVLYFLAGMLPWLAISEAVGRAPAVMLEHRNFVRRLVFPVETLPVNLALAGYLTSLFALVVFVAALLIVRGAVPLSILWLPVLVAPQLLLTLGLAWMLAALGVFLRDLGQINHLLLTLWFFLTPICYPEASLPAWAIDVFRHNPLYALVRGYRAVLLESAPPPGAESLLLWLASVTAFFAGHALFYKLRRSFADVV